MNLNEFTDLNDYMDFLNNLCIYITFFYSIILILDELYNIGIFAFKYTYNYNYGSATQNFNGVNTIEFETSRFKTYNNINFLKTDIFNNTYFNYLITVSITLITIISSISYGIYFYYTIINSSLFCKYDISDELMSYPKKFLKCICNDCHKILPNCSFNYLILLLIIIIIPIVYIIKLFLKYDFTPTSNIIFMIISIVLFSYIYNIYDNNQTKATSEIIKEILIFFFFSLIFIISLLVHKNIYDTYNDTSLNTNLKDDYVMYDIYKQVPPNKLSPIPLPIFRGNDLLKTFKMVDGGDSGDADYDNKKLILEKYYSDKKDYDIAMNEYNLKNDSYNSIFQKQKLKLGDKTYYFDIMIDMIGIKNRLNLAIIIIIIILLGLYYYYGDDLFLSALVYLINVLILITLINAITYYNTYLNKYIIYEPSSYYKNDITIANTKLNMYFNTGNGDNFYHILNNNASINHNINDDLNRNNIINSIKTLTSISNFNIDNIKLIASNIDDYNKFNARTVLEKSDELDTIIYYKIDNSIVPNITNPIEYLLSIIQSIRFKENDIDNFKIINYLNLNFSSQSYQISLNFSYYYGYLYYKLYYFKALINNLLINDKYKPSKLKLKNLYFSVDRIIKLLEPYRSNIIIFKSATDTDYPTDINHVITVNTITQEQMKTAFNNKTIEKLIDTSTISGITATTPDLYDTIYDNIKKILFTYDLNKFNIYIPISLTLTTDATITIDLVKNIINYDDQSTSNDNLKLEKLNITAISTDLNKDCYLVFNNKNLSKIKSTISQPTMNNGSNIYYEFPNRITDNYNNDVFFELKKSYYETITPAAPAAPAASGDMQVTIAGKINTNENILYYINYDIKNPANSDMKYNIKSYYNIDSSDIITNIPQSSFNKITTNKNVFKLDISLISSTKKLYIPSKIYKNIYTSAINPQILLKKLILNVLYNNLINITTRFNNSNFYKLFTSDNSKIQLIDYSGLFTKPQATYNLSTLSNFITAATTATTAATISEINVLGYIILLYNIYNYDSNKLMSIIEYLVYMKNSDAQIYTTASITINNIFNNLSTIFSNSITTSSPSKPNPLITNWNIIDTKIIKPKNNNDYDKNDYFNKDLVKYYEKNKYLVNLIINIYSNLFINVKSVISSIDKENLCFSTYDKNEIEKNLYNHITNYYTLPDTRPLTSAPASSVTIKASLFNKDSKQKLLDINQEIINVFKIIDFLFENLSSDNVSRNTLSQEQDEIIKNYNFYNPELYDNIKDFTKEELFINCNYVNKYNNLETSKLELFKYNCDNVAYNFPILLIIFVVIFGESYLIKY
jgi:hypothetical protein